jgi:hypothetical protein
MEQSKIYPQCWGADEGKVFVRISDGEVMGEAISLGKDDSIENYKEVEIDQINE